MMVAELGSQRSVKICPQTIHEQNLRWLLCIEDLPNHILTNIANSLEFNILPTKKAIRVAGGAMAACCVLAKNNPVTSATFKIRVKRSVVDGFTIPVLIVVLKIETPTLESLH